MARIYLLLVCSLYSVCTLAQDTHYWNSQYGPGGFLTPGAVIAATGDSGVYYYNPALLAGERISGISVNAVLYQTQLIHIKDGAGKGLGLKSRSNASVPNMLAGGRYLKPLKLSIVWALIHTPGIRYVASQRRDDKFQVLEEEYSPGTEFFVGQFVEENRASETRAQLATGFKLGERWSAGLTVGANVYAQRYSQDYVGRAFVNPGVVNFDLVTADASYVVDYRHYGLKFRPGVAYDNGAHHLGLTVNLPLLHLGGNGTLVSDNLVQNLVLTTPDSPLGFMANTRQEKLPVRWKTPFSIAAGYLVELSGKQLYVSAEYFGRVREYNIITPRDEYFIRPDTGTSNLFTRDLLRLKDARKGVTNVSVGMSFPVQAKMTGYVSARTDFSFYDAALFKDDSGIPPYTAMWNNFHLQFGANRWVKKSNIRAGVVLSYGMNNKYRQAVNYDNPTEQNLLQGDMADVGRARHIMAGVLLCYTHH
ncbi:hypothetical protein MKQ68_09660 [Chitinophaga horti]|uniref:Long-chain fatty acid transport protein n=1 Tax=Chitinophaga horti TaxID=2920382 RepID=A0ABY6J6Q5_9BACT|nr:hypothetical protein [Chitinophaga horti]UYQ95363.1 hypothetical protein MKQ68_09660 [Chitinophaga horti]